ncbi:hypothetical protein GQ53DRAFT_817835 [Thozetella sp. PMI_491]|nr:hypothetical protein GQ53DRAFT_817835 [Thozetella sp. PMI_491]
MASSPSNEKPDIDMKESTQTSESTDGDSTHPKTELITALSQSQRTSKMLEPISTRPRSLSLGEIKHSLLPVSRVPLAEPRAASASPRALRCSDSNPSAVKSSEGEVIASPENISAISQEPASSAPEVEVPPTSPLIKEESQPELQDEPMEVCHSHSPTANGILEHSEEETGSKAVMRSSARLKEVNSKNKEDASSTTNPTTKKRKRTPAEYWEAEWSRIQAEDADTLDPKRRNRILDYAAKRSNILTEAPTGISSRAEQGDDIEFMEDIEARKKDTQWLLIKQSIDMSDPAIVADLRVVEQASLSFGFAKCKPTNGKWRLQLTKKAKIMFETPLFHHQMVGVSWMLARELAPQASIRGGILADEMGLGKTLEMLACASLNPPTARAKGKRGTLVLCPRGLVLQWKSEIYKHHEDKRCPSVTIYTLKSDKDKEDWQRAGFVIATYAQLALGFPRDKVIDRVERMRKEKNNQWKALFEKHASNLLKHKWWRVVLDEGHGIRNRDSLRSRSCGYISSAHRWFLTGTPVQNSTDELFPVLRFLITKREELLKYEQFRNIYGVSQNISEHSENMTRLRTLNRTITLSRKGTDTLMGKAILEVPAPYPTELESVELRPHEREIWNALLNPDRSQPKRNAFKLCNQMRKAAAHFGMVEPNPLPSDGTEAAQDFPGDSIERFCRLCCRVLLCPLISASSECRHAFCRSCISSAKRSSKKKVKTGKSSSKNAEKTGFECPSCLVWITDLKQCRDASKCYQDGERPDEVGKRRGWANSRRTKTAKKRKRKNQEKKRQPDIARHRQLKLSTEKHRVPGDDENGFQPLMNAVDGKALEFLNEYDKFPWNPVPQSAKTKRAMEKILEWQREAPGEKIIVFARWLFPMVVLGQTLFQHGIKFLYYWGNLRPEERQTQIDSFKSEEDIKVMLISITSGGEGLNLTAASRAILLDLSWHTGEEQQAFGRIHRIGQTKRVHTVRIIAKDTLDERILEIQERKQENISEMSEGKTSKGPTKGDLMQLFHQSGLIGHVEFGTDFEDEQDEYAPEKDEGSESEDEGSETDESEYSGGSVSSGTIE